MVKLARGGRRQVPPGRPEPKPLFPPGKLPVFGPPPVNSRGPPPPRHHRQGMGMGYGPGPGMPPRPPPPLMRPLPMGPPLPPPPHHHRVGPPPPLMGPHPPPLMGGPHGMPPRPMPPFMHRRRPPMGRPGMGPPVKRLNKNFRKNKRRNNKNEDSDEMAEWCEVCDRGFPDLESLEEHNQEHTKCGIDGCNYEAHFKMVQAHIKLQHKSGLFARLKESVDVKQWIEERKKNFPTKDNVERKMKMKEEMKKRGELMNNDAEKRIPKKSFDKKKHLKSRNKTQRLKRCHEQFQTEEEKSEKRRKFIKRERENSPSLIASLPPEALVEDEVEDKGHWSDSEWTVDNSQNNSASQETPVNSSLSLLMDYNSDLESNIDESKGVNDDAEKKGNDWDDDDAPEEVKTEKAVEVDRVSEQTSHIEKAIVRRAPNRQPKLPHKKQLTLLEKLLKNEIRQERNRILQCIRYIVDNNFFDPEKCDDLKDELKAASVDETSIVTNC